MTYNNVVSRSDAAALIPEDYSKQIIEAVPQSSAAMALFQHVTMSRAQQRLPVMSALPVAYFVNGDTGLKQTSEMGWTNKYLNAEEIAVIVPIAEAVIDDAAYDIWGEMSPQIASAVGRTLDAAIFFGTNKPASWPADITTSATTAGSVVTAGTNPAASGGIVGDISDTFAHVEGMGYDVNGVVANRKFRGLLRQARSTTGEQLGTNAEANGDIQAAPGQVYGVDISYPLRGLWPTGSGASELIAGDFTEGLLGVRQDLTYKILDQAVIQDNAGVIQYNLAQQDMVAMRVVARFAWQVKGTLEPENVANAYPFAVLKAA